MSTGSSANGAMTVNVIVNVIQLDVVRDIAVDMVGRCTGSLLLFCRRGVRRQGRRLDRIDRLMMGGRSELLLMMMVVVMEVRMER